MYFKYLLIQLLERFLSLNQIHLYLPNNYFKIKSFKIKKIYEYISSSGFTCHKC